MHVIIVTVHAIVIQSGWVGLQKTLLVCTAPNGTCLKVNAQCWRSRTHKHKFDCC